MKIRLIDDHLRSNEYDVDLISRLTALKRRIIIVHVVREYFDISIKRLRYI